MNRPFCRVLSGLAVLLAVCQSIAAEDASGQPIAEQVIEGCGSQLETYCSEVTPGEGRILACLYAHQDKLSGQCEYALYGVLPKEAVVELLLRSLYGLESDAEALQPTTPGHFPPGEAVDVNVSAVGQAPVRLPQQYLSRDAERLRVAPESS